MKIVFGWTEYCVPSRIHARLELLWSDQLERGGGGQDKGSCSCQLLTYCLRIVFLGDTFGASETSDLSFFRDQHRLGRSVDWAHQFVRGLTVLAELRPQIACEHSDWVVAGKRPLN